MSAIHYTLLVIIINSFPPLGKAHLVVHAAVDEARKSEEAAAGI